MNLYEIDQKILALVDPETGEILDYEAFSELKMERKEKIESMALWDKNLRAEAAAIRAEEVALAKRRNALEKKADKLESYIAKFLSGNKFSTARVACTFRKSEAVNFVIPEAEFVQKMTDAMRYEYLSYGQPKPNKTAITKAIKDGLEVPGAQLIEKNNLSIK